MIRAEKDEQGVNLFKGAIRLKNQIDTKNRNVLDLTIEGNKLTEIKNPTTGQKKYVSVSRTYHGEYATIKSELTFIKNLTKNLSNYENFRCDEYYHKKIEKKMSHLCFEVRLTYLGEIGEFETAMAILKHENPKKFFNEGEIYRNRLVNIFLAKHNCISNYPLPGSLRLPEPIEEAIYAFKQGIVRGRVQIVVINANLERGKTQFVKDLFKKELNLFPYTINSNKQDLKDFNPYIHNAIIFDDWFISPETREILIALISIKFQITKIQSTNVIIPKSETKTITKNKPLQMTNSSLTLNNKDFAERILYIKIPKDQKLCELGNKTEIFQSENKINLTAKFIEVEDYI
jgi:hypothetical protein